MTRVYLTNFYETSLFKNGLVIYIPLLVDKFYSVFKKDFCIENYLLRLSEQSRIWITKFRTSNCIYLQKLVVGIIYLEKSAIVNYAKKLLETNIIFYQFVKMKTLSPLEINICQIIIEFTLIMPYLKVFFLFAIQNFISHYQFLLEKLLPYSDYM